MTFAVPCLVAITLLLAGAVAGLPEIWREATPRQRDLPAAITGHSRWIVVAPGQRWYLDGQAVSRGRLAAILSGPRQEGEVRLLPASTLPIGEVSEALAWLRSLSPRPVLLQLPPERR